MVGPFSSDHVRCRARIRRVRADDTLRDRGFGHFAAEDRWIPSCNFIRPGPRMRASLIRAALLGTAALVNVARAQPAQPAQPPDEEVAIERPRPVGEATVTVERQWTATTVDGAPAPGQESGRLDDVEGHDSGRRLLARGLLFVPRALFEIGFAPVRAGVYAVDRYKLPERFRRWFYTEGEEFGLMPWARYDSDEGLLAGARVLWMPKDVTASAFAGVGLQYQRVTASLRTRQLAERVELGVDGEFRHRPRAAFYGIGNADETEVTSPGAPLVDPLVDDTAIETRFKKRILRASTYADVRLFGDAYARGVASFSDIGVSPGPSDELSPEEVYEPASLNGVEDYRYAYGELELRWDTRRKSSIWEPIGLSSRGFLLSAFAGGVSIVDGEAFWRYGGDLQQFVRVGRGPQVLAARLHGEAVTAALDEIPFPELPRLGGSALLRGYPLDRFRDRVALVGTLEYQWQHVYASLFADVGRVYRELSDISLEDLRCGYGLALEAHSRQSFQARVSVASSIDGGLFFYLHLEPVFITPRREERR
jgi:hypothetical protein